MSENFSTAQYLPTMRDQSSEPAKGVRIVSCQNNFVPEQRQKVGFLGIGVQGEKGSIVG